MSGTLIVDSGATTPTTLLLVPVDSTPVQWVASSPAAARRKIKDLIDEGSVSRIVVDSTGFGLATYQKLCSDLCGTQVRVDGINAARSIRVEERAA